MKKYKLKLTDPNDTPFRHEEYADRDKNGVWQTDDKGALKHTQEFKKGDIIEVSKPAAQHLMVSKQAIPINIDDVAELMSYAG